MTIALVRDFASLAALEPQWWDLFARVPGATPFASPAWVLPWWSCFHPGELFVVALSEGDRLVGLVPLYVEDGPWGRRLLPLGLGLTDMTDILLDPVHAADAGAVLGQALQELHATCTCWSAEEAPPEAAVLALAELPGWRSTTVAHSACPALPVPARDALRGAIPPRQWRKWQMARHRADRRSWSVTEATAASLDDDLAALFRLHGARWRERGEAGVLGEDAVQRFHASAAPALLAAGLLRLRTLRLGGQVAGVYYGLARGSTSYAYLGGFDPAFAFESPGTLLIGAAIEEAVAEGATLFSFLRGQEPYKYAWGAVDRWNQRRTFEPVR